MHSQTYIVTIVNKYVGLVLVRSVLHSSGGGWAWRLGLGLTATTQGAHELLP